MSKLLKSKIVLGVVVAAGLAFAGSAGAAYMHTITLKMGSSNSQVMSLQQTLNMTACQVGLAGTAGGPGTETSYFGAKTAAAVKCFQASKGVTADGIVGPITGALLGSVATGNFPAGCTSAAGYSTTTGMPCNAGPSTGLPAGCSSTAGYSPLTGTKCDSTGPSTPSTGGPLQGGAGALESADFISSLNNEEVGEGQDDVEILGLELEADDNSDLRLLSLRVLFANEHDHDAASSDDLDDYATEVTVWFDGKKVGSADVEDFSENNDVWSKTIAIDSSAIIRAEDTENLVIAISAVNNIDSVDEEETWTVEVDSLRYEDAQGAIITETSLGGIGDERDFSFESFSTAQDVGMKVSLSNDDDINDARVIDVDTADETDGVEIFSFDVEAEGDSDLWLDKVVVDFTTSEDDLNDVISRACLFADGDELACVNITSEDATDVPVTFDDLDYTIDAGDTITFIVEVDFEEIDADFVAGTTLLAEITDDETDLWDVEDESGDDLSDGEKTGSAAGGAHGAFAVGMMAKFVSSTATVQKSGIATVHDQGTFTVVFDVTAFDSDIYIDRTVITDEAGGATYQNIVVNGAVGTGVVTSSNADTAANETYKVPEGQTRRFTVTMQAAAADGGGFVDAALESILYALTAVDGDLLYTFDMGDYKTDPVYLSDN